jgi:TetR/AcrR family transcriptional regulator, transcriptional repressor of bet genes
MLEKRKVKERPRTHPEINEYRRNALIEGTIRSLAEHGVAGTTVRSICAEADSSRGLMSHYFESKEHLLEIAFRYLYDTAANYVAKCQAAVGDDPEKQLRALPMAVFSPKVNTPLIRNAFITFWHEIRFNPLVREANSESYRAYQDRTETLFAAAAKQHGITIDARQASIGLITMIDGHWLVLSTYERMTSRDRAIKCCQNYIDLQLGLPVTASE